MITPGARTTPVVDDGYWGAPATIDWPDGEPARIREAAETRLRSARFCPIHGSALDGGPVQFHCPVGHRVQAADLNHETHREVA